MSVLESSTIWDRVLQYALKPLAVAIAFVNVALLWTLFLQHWMNYPFVFLFIAAIMGSAWFGGRAAGMIAVVLSSFIVTYFFIPPLYSITVGAESESFLAAFIVFAITTSLVSSTRKRAEMQVLKARDLLEARVQERTAELERSNREIQQSELQLRLLTEELPQQIWRADARGAVEYVNQHLCEYLGIPEAALLGNRLFRTLHPKDAYLVHNCWAEAVHSGIPLEVEARVLGAGNEYRWFLIRAFPHRSEEQEIVRWYGLHIDIEDRQRERQSLHHRQEDISRLSQTLSMSEVAATIAHQLHQPLTALMSNAYACIEWANCEPPNLPKVKESAQEIVKECTRASEVVRRVRALFSGEELVRIECDINQLIEDSSRLLRDDMIREGVKLELLLSERLPKASIDPIQIQQVIINLAKNAIEAMSHLTIDRVLTISTANRRESGGKIVITVCDTGPGISQDVLEEVFLPFFSTKRNGTGIGLAICRSIVESHNGRISAMNGPSGGAMIQFAIPVKV